VDRSDSLSFTPRPVAPFTSHGDDHPLCRTYPSWGRVRSALARAGLVVYGERTGEARQVRQARDSGGYLHLVFDVWRPGASRGGKCWRATSVCVITGDISAEQLQEYTGCEWVNDADWKEVDTLYRRKPGGTDTDVAFRKTG
jgi:hypothetical protein